MVIKAKFVYTPHRILVDHGIRIENHRISSLERISNIKERAYYYPLIVPGFIDLHTHGIAGYDTMSVKTDDLEAMAKAYLDHGVTSFLPTTVSHIGEKIIEVVDKLVSYISKEKKGAFAKIVGIHLEGPYLSVEKKGAQNPKYIRKIDEEELKKFVERSKGFLKLITLAPEAVKPKKAEEIMRYLRKNGVRISLGHSNATFDEAMKMVDFGATHATHVFNGMRGFNHREPGVVGAVLLDDRVTCEIIADLVHLHPMTLRLIYRLKGPEKIVAISDSISATDLEDGEYELGGLKVMVKDGVARLEDGTLAGSILTLDRALKNLVKVVGIPLIDALKFMTSNPARELGLHDVGEIRVGNRADLVCLDENLDLLDTFVNGMKR